MESQALALICGLSAISFMASAKKPLSRIAWLAGFGLTLIAVNPLLPGLPVNFRISVAPSQIALIIVILSSVLIGKPVLSRQAALFSGSMSAFWVAALVSQGYGPELSLSLVIVVSLTTYYCVSRVPNFSNKALREEANLIVLASALALAIVPEMVNGWYATTSDQATEVAGSTNSVAPGVLLVAGLFVILGVLYTNWKRR